MTVLVTGAAGFIGSHLTERLVAEGHEVRGVDAFTDYYDPARKRDNVSALGDTAFELTEGDLNALDLEALVEGAETVFHLAGQPGVRASWGKSFEIYADQNVLATQRLLEACKATSVRRVVYASSSSVYGDAERFPTVEEDLPAPISPYGVTKLAGEHLCRLYFKAYGLETVSLRYFTIYGPRQRPDMAFCRFIDAALGGDPVTVFGDGEQVRDFTYVSDAVGATVAAATAGRPGLVYNVAGGTQTSVREVVDVIGELTGRPIDVQYQEAVAGDARRTGADTSQAERDLDYSPSVDLRAGLALQVAHARGGGGR
jgi:UDP-glucuronate 4-epimerase